MVEVIRKGLGWEVECICGAVLKFQWNDMKYLNEDDAEYKASPEHARKAQYIICPVCSSKVFVKNDSSGWRLGVKRICRDASTEEV